ncbi:MAG: triose-phosphate isomerase [Clostridia bacterium]|nr:triose-phosphate isomerase [Clostridia bacterium]
MVKDYKISTPFFEFGPKAYLYGEELLALMKKIDGFAQKYDMDVIADVQTTDLRLIAENTSDRIHVYAQHMDSIPIGRGMGTILPEAVKATGAVGVMLNHAECKLTLGEVKKAIERADEVGLATIVCADKEEEIKAIAEMNPNILVAEPSELIGTGIAVGREYVDACIDLVKSVNPEIMVLPSAGISCGQDCYNIIKAGADGSGSSSGICKAPDPAAMAEEMMAAVRRAFDEREGK